VRGWCSGVDEVCYAAGQHAFSSARSQHAAVTLGTSLYVFGGWTADPRAPDQSRDAFQFVPPPRYLEQIDTRTHAAQPLHDASAATYPAPRKAMGMVAWQSRYLIVFGGQVRAKHRRQWQL